MKLRNNQTITVLQVSTGETTTFKCIKHKEYLRNIKHYNNYRDPKNFLQIINGGYLIIDSPNEFHWDRVICSELTSTKSFKDYEIINPIEIQNGDIISYRKTKKPNAPIFKLTFRTTEECKTCKKEDGVYYIPNNAKGRFQFETLFDSLNYCYPGKYVNHMKNSYYIVDVKKSTKNKISRVFSNIKKDLQSILGIIKNHHKK